MLVLKRAVWDIARKIAQNVPFSFLADASKFISDFLTDCKKFQISCSLFFQLMTAKGCSVCCRSLFPFMSLVFDRELQLVQTFLNGFSMLFDGTHCKKMLGIEEN